MDKKINQKIMLAVAVIAGLLSAYNILFGILQLVFALVASYLPHYL